MYNARYYSIYHSPLREFCLLASIPKKKALNVEYNALLGDFSLTLMAVVPFWVSTWLAVAKSYGERVILCGEILDIIQFNTHLKTFEDVCLEIGENGRD